jgi:hypothetical protein
MTDNWLEEIELRVREAALAARRLRTENAALRRRVTDLEKRLQTAAGDTLSGEWPQERQEVRRRLEDLVAHLERLVENPAADS